MLGCIQPMSSPMMKRIFGFVGCCADGCEPAATTAATPARRLSQNFRLTFMTASFDFQGWSILAELLSNDAAESQVACGRVHILCMTRRGAVPPAVVGRA